MSSFKRGDRKDDEDSNGNIFQHLEKTTVLQEARTFNETPVNAKKCTQILTKLLYLLNQGEQLSTVEATDAFFQITKLFQSKDVILRRMVYLAIKELSTIADDVIIVTSSLTKDMTGKEDLYRPAAIRALCSITDVTMLQAIERYMKQAIVDRNPAVSSAALVSALHLTKIANDVVKRWVNEAQEAANSENLMVQCHALGVLFHIRKSDHLAVSKVVLRLVTYSSKLKSPYAVCMLIRIICKLLEEDYNATFFDFIGACLRNKSEMVMYEAANAYVNLKCSTARDIDAAISVLQLFCGSAKPTIRFAAVRTLNKVAMTKPAAVTACNLDLENLITDSNRSIATLAITTLLKTGAESSVDRLMKQISTFVSEISDEFKIVVVQAIQALCLKFPRKHLVLMSFLSSMLRDEGGLDYKASIADTIITIIEENPDAKEVGLAHLCEFIEDCEHTSLLVRILHLLGREGPRTKTPSRYIRFIYNRVLLESASIRAAAVSALAQFGAACPDLRPNICVLLSRCQMDSDDVVRDRATYYTHILMQDDQKLLNNYIIEPLQVSIPALERALNDYLQSPSETPFDIKTVPLAPIIPVREQTRRISTHQDADIIKPTLRETNLAEHLATIPEIQALGPIFKSNREVPLTESETEYNVRLVTHVFAGHLVLQYNCLNTLNDQLLENVHVQLDVPEGFELLMQKACERLPFNEEGRVFCVLQFPDDFAGSMGAFASTLKFIVKDCDPTTGLPDTEDGYEEEYILEDFEISLSDQVQKLQKVNFALSWDESAESFVEIEDTYALASANTLQEAVNNVVEFLGMMPAERSDRVPDGKTTHTVQLAGLVRGGYEVLIRAKLAQSDGVTMHLTVRSNNEDVARVIIGLIG